MADKDDDKDKAEPEPLTEAQRLENLEKKVGLSKTIMMIVALLLVMLISIGVTAFVVFVGQSDDTAVLDQITALQDEMTDFVARLDAQNAQLDELASSVSVVSQKLKNSSNSVVVSLMVEQEASNQLFLDAARASIFDLAHMVPGSRTWLDVYSDKLDAAIKDSKARVERLKTLESGATTPPNALEEEDDGFGDF